MAGYAFAVLLFASGFEVIVTQYMAMAPGSIDCEFLNRQPCSLLTLMGSL
jgi:hypothetical protein